MEQQNIFEQKEKITKKQYTKDDMYHIAELYGHYYLAINTHNNILSPNRVQINNQHWKAFTLEYNKRQALLPNNEGYFRSEKALLEKYDTMKTTYQNKKETITSTGSGGGPLLRYLQKMHNYLHKDPQLHPKATYSSLKRAYSVRDGEDNNDDVVVSEDSCPPRSFPPSASIGEQKKKRKSVKEEKELARVKSRDETLEQMKQITEGMTRKLEEIMSKPLVVQHVESEEKKEFYKKFLELMENGLK
ncbi:uncharacterized protein EV154DRAFT_582278 [Mucor mucedo]|uniref:uncharacterized protein n=1 Tax=Mucor mucedo TaxID=29922 RepID=UPI00221FCCD9|nr:uncharacterized protein EV154DRAFT_582278 [Mucor mucedo]KAI7868057.1 hypothetical protein EV154DRAFT_582278 [Mucor mucedo]